MRTVQVWLDNRWAQLSSEDPGVASGLKHFWSFTVPGCRFMPAYKSGAWDGRISLMKNNRVPAGLFRATQQEIEQTYGIQFDIVWVLPDIQQPLEFVGDFDPKYKYQQDCVAAMCQNLQVGGGIVLSATGTGKTAMAGMFFSRLQYSCLFVVDQLDLLYQAQQELTQWTKEKIGIIGDSTYQPERITVATIQTLHRHIDDPKFLRWYKQVRVVLVDELHEQMARRNFSVLNHIKPLACYGLTATLQLQKKEIRTKAYAFAGPVIYEFPVAKGIEEGVLSQGKVLQLRFAWQPGEDGDYQTEYRQQVTENDEKTDACKALVSFLLKKNRYVLLLCQRVAHLQSLSQAFAAQAISHRLAYGEIDKFSRAQSVGQFEDGQVRLIIANQVFRKGINIKRVDVIIDMAEMKSKNDALQKFGRGVRLHPSKAGLLYIDIGTQGSNRFSKAAKSRLRALKNAGIPVRAVNINTVQGAIRAVEQELTFQKALTA